MGKAKKKVVESEVIARYEGIHPTLGIHHTLTLFADKTVKIERSDYTYSGTSLYDGKEISETQSFATITEPIENHRALISYFEDLSRPANTKIGLAAGPPVFK